ncbi:MAG: glycoside hydrolase family 1 protein [Dermatophilaceae bacterium]
MTAVNLSGLLIGAATAAVQIEGGDTGNQWHAFAQTPGRILDGSTPTPATDHWTRWREDTDLLTELGLQVYRLGIEWSRIEPEPGRVDEAAVERYRAELAELGRRGIRPLVTMHHFSHPTWFEDRGGWTAPDAVETFLGHVERVVTRFGDLVREWVTINEPNVYATGGFLFGEFPPGRTGGWADIRLVLHTMARAHCRAYHLIHDLQPEARVGIAHHLRVFAPLSRRNPVHRLLARTNAYLFQEAITDAMLGGRFPRVLGAQPADVAPGSHYDYLGINYYSRTAVSRLADGRFDGVPVNDLGWEIHPQGLVEVARWLHGRYPGPIWVTENGTADRDDAFRARFVADHLSAMASSGLPFERYYHWCLVDNWEWAQGHTARFGLVELDVDTMERRVRPSGRFVARAIAAGGIDDTLYEEFVAGSDYRMAP